MSPQPRKTRASADGIPLEDELELDADTAPEPELDAPAGVGRVLVADQIDTARAPGPMLMRAVSDAVTELEAAYTAAGADVRRGGRGMAVDVVIAVVPPGRGADTLRQALA